MAAHGTDDHDRGLAFDLRTMSRRRALTMISGGTLAVLAACGSDSKDTADPGTSPSAPPASSPGSQSTGAGSSAVECETIPEETAGPYPANGSNGPDVLTQNGVVRSDIRSSFGPYSGTAEGMPLTFTIVVLDSTANCHALSGAAVYAWHCSREAGYSLYSEGVENQNFLRGVQPTDGNGRATFKSIFPAAYSGRWPHIHFEVYKDVATATGGGRPIVISQIALPKEACEQVYATQGYEQSARNLARVSLSSDMVFADDDGRAQLGTASGDVTAGFAIELSVPVDPNGT